MTDEARREALIERIEGVRERWRRLAGDVGPDRLEEPGAMGDWTFKDVAVHLTTWRRRTVSRLEAAARGEPQPPNPWPPELADAEDDPINAWIHDQTKDHPAAELLIDADAVYDDFVAAVRALPIDAVVDNNRFPWLEGVALADSDFSVHLGEHEPDVRRWLAGG
jgi:mycothiol maleylpyruvate isomerase-like protein